MPKSNHSKSSTTKALEKATKDWRSAKKRERAARNALAAVVNEAVASGVMSENKVASVTSIPRMTIRKMLGKDEASVESVDHEVSIDVVSVDVVEDEAAVAPDEVVTDEVVTDEVEPAAAAASPAEGGSDEGGSDEGGSDEGGESVAIGTDEPAGDDPSASTPAFTRPVTPTWASPPSSTFTT